MNVSTSSSKPFLSESEIEGTGNSGIRKTSVRKVLGTDFKSATALLNTIWSIRTNTLYQQNGFQWGSLCDWSKNLTPLFPPSRSKTQANRNVIALFSSHSGTHFSLHFGIGTWVLLASVVVGQRDYFVAEPKPITTDASTTSNQSDLKTNTCI